jgi:hypothetical protein
MLSRFTVDLQGTVEAKEWDKVLSLLLWAYRSHYHHDFRASPFYMLFGRQPRLPIHLNVQQIDATSPAFKSRFQHLKELAIQMPSIWKFAQECLDEIAKRYQRVNISHGKALAKPLPIGTSVYVRVLDSRKIVKGKPKWAGPYKITDVPSTASYRLADPADPQRTLLIWAGHVRRAEDADGSERKAPAESSPVAAAAAAPRAAQLPFDPDDLDHGDDD